MPSQKLIDVCNTLKVTTTLPSSFPLSSIVFLLLMFIPLQVTLLDTTVLLLFLFTCFRGLHLFYIGFNLRLQLTVLLFKGLFVYHSCFQQAMNYLTEVYILYRHVGSFNIYPYH